MAPAELLSRRQHRNRLDLLKPNTAQRIEQKQQSQKARHDAKSKDRTLKSGNQVYVRNYLRGDKWFPGVIIERIASQMFKVQMNGGKIRRCRSDQLMKQDLNLTEPPADITSSTTPGNCLFETLVHPELPIRNQTHLNTQIVEITHLLRLTYLSQQ